MYTNNKIACQALCLLAVLCGQVVAAPTGDTASESQPAAIPDASGAGSAAHLAAPQLNSGSRTVDLLIELQGKQAGLGVAVTDRAAVRADTPAPSSGSSGRLAGPPALETSGTGLFDTSPATLSPARDTAQAMPGNPERRGAVADGGPDTAAPNPAPRPHQARLAPDGDQLSLLRDAVRWLRENRDWVIATSVVLLVAVGAASRRKGRRT